MQSPPFGGKCEHHPVAGRGGWETCWSGHLWKNIVAERVLGQGNSEEVAPLVFFFAERPVIIGPNLPMDRYCKVFRFLFKIFFPYQLYPGLERGSLLLLLFL